MDSDETTHQEIGYGAVSWLEPCMILKSEAFRNNLARIDVFFDSLLVLEYVEATIYTVSPRAT